MKIFGGPVFESFRRGSGPPAADNGRGNGLAQATAPGPLCRPAPATIRPTGAFPAVPAVGRGRCFLAVLFSCRERRPAGLQWTIAIAPATPGRFDAFLGDRLIAANTPSPFLSGARALLAEGLAAPDDEVVLIYHAHPALLCLRATVGDAARHGVFA
jgi:hypothetical protein